MTRPQTKTIGTLLRARSRWHNYVLAALLVALGYFAIALPTWRSADALGVPEMISGYSLLGILLVTALFNIRKRLPMLPLLRMRWWTLLHVCAGLLILAVFWLHTDTLWPKGLYEQALASLVYLTCASGMVGLLLERLHPARLTQTSVEVIFERIPAEIAELRQRVEDLILACTRETRHDTLARYYVETLQWYFVKPRFFSAYIRGSQSAEFWLEQRFTSVRRYLNSEEQRYLERLEDLAEQKAALDAHYAGQLLLRNWLMVHVPCAAALIPLALWHTLLVHVYAL